MHALNLPAKIERLRRPRQDLLHLELRSEGRNRHLLFVLAPPFAGPFECDQSPLAGQAPHPSQAMLRKEVKGAITGLRTAPGLWELYTSDGRVLCISWRRKMRGVWWADKGRLGGDFEPALPKMEAIQAEAFERRRVEAEAQAWRAKERARIERNILKLKGQSSVDDASALRGLAERANALRGQVKRHDKGWMIPHYDGSAPECVGEAASPSVSALVDKLFHRAKRVERRKAATHERIRALKRRLTELETLHPKPKSPSMKDQEKPVPKGIRVFVLSDGHEVLVGRQAQGNHQLTFRLARGRDLWFHLRDGPGSHVVLRLEKGEEPSAALTLAAAALALHYSTLRGERADVRIAYRRDLDAVPGKPGTALVRREQVMMVDPRGDEVRKALEQFGLDLSSST